MKKVYILLVSLTVVFLLIFLITNERVRSIHTRMFKKLKKRDTPSEQFVVKGKYNYHPEAEGVISTSLYGDGERYIESVLKGKVYRPSGWYLRVYLCPLLKEKLIEKLVDRDFEIFVMKEPSEGSTGTLWRFLPMEEGKPFISIDADDLGDIKRMNFSNRYCLNVPDSDIFRCWKESNKSFISLGSSLCSKIMAGKWGSSFKYDNLTQELNAYDLREFGQDEVFLKEKVLPLTKKYGLYKVNKFCGNRLKNFICLVSGNFPLAFI